jgi:endonuclease/exonuclease/phosphatase family metal-dependent hydrolase
VPVVATYNIHACVGTDRKLCPARIAAVIDEMQADIVALQEVDAEAHPGSNQWEFLGQATGCLCIPGISLRTHRREYGNALLTRLPVDFIRLHDLSVDRREPRGAIDVGLLVDGKILRVIATHLGLKRHERQSQIAALLAKIQEDQAKEEGVLLLGDFNEWLPGSANIRRLHSAFSRTIARPTFPARRPFLALDRIFARGAIALRDHAVHRSPLAAAASDHLPLVAQCDWAFTC